jgi:hypothetical protein
MKNRFHGSIIGVLLAAGFIFICLPWQSPSAKEKFSSSEEGMMTVLNPRGKPPAIPLVPMAPRLDTLDGKTVYFVDVRFPGGGGFLHELMDWFAQNRPKVKTVFREKAGSYMDGDPKLWAEIKEKGDAMIIAIGH